MRWVVRILVVLVVLIVLAVGALFLIPADRIAALATDRFEAATGRAVTLKGSVRPSLYPDIGVSLGGIEIANADWSDAGPMLQADKISVAVDLGALFGGDVHIRRATISNPSVRLERHANGRANWDFGTGDGSTGSDAGGGGASPLALDVARIEGGEFSYVDHGSGQEFTLSDFDLSATLPDGQRPASIEVSGMVNGERLTLDASLDQAGEFLSGDGTQGALALSLAGTTASFDGAASLTGENLLVGNFSAGIASTGDLMRALGRDAPGIPLGAGQAITLAGDLALTSGKAVLSNAALGLDHNQMTGDLTLATGGERPHVTANLSTGDFDLSSLAADDGDDSEGWSTDPIDLSGLGAIDGDFVIAANSIDIGHAKFDRSRIVATLRDGLLSADIREMAAYGGAMTGAVHVSGRNGMSVDGAITASGVALQAFLADFIGFERITGSGDLAVDFRGSGGSIDALMNSLTGTGRIEFGQGEILGFDLISMLRNLEGSFADRGGSTIFNSITASFDLTDGVVNNVDLNFLAPLADALGEGTIGLGQRTMNYRVTPKLLRGEAGEAGISVPILISGPWSNLSFRPDLAGLIDLKAQEVIKGAGEAAKQTIEEGIQGSQENLQQQLQDKVKKGLGGLLGGN
jgi:AsmA protein